MHADGVRRRLSQPIVCYSCLSPRSATGLHHPIQCCHCESTNSLCYRNHHASSTSAAGSRLSRSHAHALHKNCNKHCTACQRGHCRTLGTHIQGCHCLRPGPCIKGQEHPRHHVPSPPRACVNAPANTCAYSGVAVGLWGFAAAAKGRVLVWPDCKGLHVI
jgi:hypothetical protein